MKFNMVLRSTFGLVLAPFLVFPLIVGAQVKTGSIAQLSLSTSGGAPAGSSDSPAIASNGRVLAFTSSAENLVSNDSNKQLDVFVRELKTGVISKVSVNNVGSEANANSFDPAVSPVTPEGLFAISFTSEAFSLGSLILPGEQRTIYIRVPALNLTEVVSFAPGAQAADSGSNSSSITLLQNPNRALVTYASNATNLVSSHFNSTSDIFLATITLPKGTGGFADLVALDSAVTTTLITKGSGTLGSDSDSYTPKISGDGQYIVFASQASNLINRVNISQQQIYRYAIATGVTELISENSAGVAADAECSSPSISFSGRFVTYLSKATNLVTGGAENRESVILHDLVRNTITRVNTNREGNVSNGTASAPAVSGNGRFIAFSDNGTNLVSDDSNGVADVFLKDLDSGLIVRLSQGVVGEANDLSDRSIIAGDSYNGLTSSIYFRSMATNLTSPSNALGGGDIFSQEATLPAPQLKKGSKVETPADVVIKGQRSVISAQKFSFPKKPAALIVEGPKTLPASTPKRAVNYEFRVEGTGNRSKVRQKLISKRNTVTTAKLKPGVYNTRYRVTATEGSKVVSKTSFSPRQVFEIK